MDLYTLDNNYRRTGYVEAYDSAIWALRYAEYGDFEIDAVYFSDLVPLIMSAAYIYDVESETAMFIEDVELETNADGIPMAKFKGRSLESILDRRIIWRKKTVYGKIQDIISTLLTENIIDPRDSGGNPETDRKIDNFIFQSNSDERLNDYTIDEHSPMELHGDNLYDTVKYLCDLYDVGFRVTLNQSDQFVFQLYCGEMLDGSNDDKKAVLFSPKMENLSNTRYLQSSQNYKNVTRIESVYELKAEQNNDDDDDNASARITAATPSWVIFPRGSDTISNGLRFMMQFHKKVAAGATLNINGTGAKPLYYKNNNSWVAIADEVIDGSDTRILVYDSTGNGRYLLQPKPEDESVNENVEQTRVLVLPQDDRPEGLERREIYTDANNVDKEEGMTPSDYADLMYREGLTTLRENRRTTEIDGESIPGVNYIFGQDYQLGDIVKVENECGITVSVRIVEYVQTIDENGPSACPSFSSVYS